MGTEAELLRKILIKGGIAIPFFSVCDSKQSLSGN